MKFHNDRFRHSSNIKGNTSIIREDVVLVLLMRGIYHVRLPQVDDIYASSFMKIGTGVQAILRFSFQKFERL
jgi:hypothetical protein